MCSRLPSALLQRVHVSVSVRFIRFVYEGSAGWCPHLNRERCTLSSRERVNSSSLIGGGCLSSMVLGCILVMPRFVNRVWMCLRSEVFWGVGGRVMCGVE